MDNPLVVDVLTKKQLNVLIQLAHADKHFAVEERAMIYRISDERSFPKEMVSALIRQPEPIVSFAYMSDDQKINHLADCIELIFADHRIFESEVIFARGIAIKLGLKKEAVDFMIEHYGEYTREMLISTVLSRFSTV